MIDIALSGNSIAKKYITWFLFTFLIILPGFTQQKSELTCEMHNTCEYRTRLYFLSDYLSFLLLNQFKNSEDHTVVWGIKSPWISYGPMNRYGLLKEMNNPLGYTPRSTVFKERSKLSLNTAFDSGKRRYLYISLFPDLFHMYIQEGDQVPPSCGGLFSIYMNNIIMTDLLFSVSRSPEKDIKDDWYADSRYLPEGNIYHLGMKSIVKAEKLCFVFSGGVSGGEFVLPGFFIQGNLSCRSGLHNLYLLFCYCSGYYTTPDGSYRKKMIRTGGALFFPVVSLLNIGVQYILDINHPSVFPGDYLYTQNIINGEISLEHDLAKNLHVSLSLTDEILISFNEEGEKKEEYEISVFGELHGKYFSGTAAYSVTRDQEEKRKGKWDICFSCLLQCHKITLQSLFFTGDDLSWKGNVDYELNKDLYKFRVSLSMKKSLLLSDSGYQLFIEHPFEYIAFTLGFKVSR